MKSRILTSDPSRWDNLADYRYRFSSLFHPLLSR